MKVPCKKITDKEMEMRADARFINFVTALANKYGVTIVECNTQTRIISFNGDQANVDAFARELCEVLEVVEDLQGQEVIDQWSDACK
jgi:acetolactate synthase small subunit